MEISSYICSGVRQKKCAVRRIIRQKKCGNTIIIR